MVESQYHAICLVCHNSQTGYNGYILGAAWMPITKNYLISTSDKRFQAYAIDHNGRLKFRQQQTLSESQIVLKWHPKHKLLYTGCRNGALLTVVYDSLESIGEICEGCRRPPSVVDGC